MDKPSRTSFIGQLDRDTVSEDELKRLTGMLTHETRLWAQGFRRVAGVDEAGRGPVAGPIVAAAVILAAPIVGLNDSKRLTEAARRRIHDQIMQGGHPVGVSIIPAGEIDARGIQAANYTAMLKAVASLTPQPDFVLVDGYDLHGLYPPATRIIHGDAGSLSIAAASIVAKVTRDRILTALDKQYPQYGFARNKGYGTREHLEALARYGPCPEHRRSFAPLAIARQEPFLL